MPQPVMRSLLSLNNKINGLFKIYVKIGKKTNCCWNLYFGLLTFSVVPQPYPVTYVTILVVSHYWTNIKKAVTFFKSFFLTFITRYSVLRKQLGHHNLRHIWQFLYSNTHYHKIHIYYKKNKIKTISISYHQHLHATDIWQQTVSESYRSTRHTSYICRSQSRTGDALVA